MAALLFHPLGLTKETDGPLEASSNQAVSQWIAQHMRVAIAPFPDRDQLSAIERGVVSMIDPPLNLAHCVPTDGRLTLSALRQAIRR